ncbi:hypothetical protein DFH28DRAFT_1124472 [Melampsora americana]|nr:hypothetical protein DFH28DRAFT_1124472 [Melampsora americana]
MSFKGRPLNPNDLSSNPYNVNSFIPWAGQCNPYSRSSNGHGNSLPEQFPNSNSQCHQEIIQRLGQLRGSGPSPNLPNTTTSTTSVPVWKPRDELKKFCVDVLLESITNPTLQAYNLTKGAISPKHISSSNQPSIRFNSNNRILLERLEASHQHLQLLHNASPNYGFVVNLLPTLPDIYLSMANFPGLYNRTATNEEFVAKATNNLGKRLL